MSRGRGAFARIRFGGEKGDREGPTFNITIGSRIDEQRRGRTDDKRNYGFNI